MSYMARKCSSNTPREARAGKKLQASTQATSAGEGPTQDPVPAGLTVGTVLTAEEGTVLPPIPHTPEAGIDVLVIELEDLEAEADPEDLEEAEASLKIMTGNMMNDLQFY